ncbi:MAG: hypothetical protein OEW00_08580 [candidate division Zixibacteria bacterium]|nr:hypothetical protein [candidate division Zixibacteria bacterium]
MASLALYPAVKKLQARVNIDADSVPRFTGAGNYHNSYRVTAVLIELI